MNNQVLENVMCCIGIVVRIVGDSLVVKWVFEIICIVVCINFIVFLCGESGIGKELFLQMIYEFLF